jgi:hypothetical protein
MNRNGLLNPKGGRRVVPEANNAMASHHSSTLPIPVLKHWLVFALVTGCLWLVPVGCQTKPSQRTSPLRVAAFACDVTPPVGHPLCGGWIQPLQSVEDPLLAKGIVLADGESRYVVCAVDWCLLQTTAHDLFREKIAKAIGAPVRNVTVHTVHQHNAPIADSDAQRLLSRAPMAPLHLDLAFMEKVTDRVANSVREAASQLRPFTHIGTGKGKVERFASNRRVRLADGKLHVRYSATQDPALQTAPEGLIDPWLRTVTFLDGTKPLVRLHYFASHPQSYYGDGRATSDTAGLARSRLEREEGVPQIHFTGCAGNITAGKYNDGSPQARAELTARLSVAMKQSIATTRSEMVHRIEWKTAQVRFAPRREQELSPRRQSEVLMNTNSPTVERLKSALNLAAAERWRHKPETEISRLRLGSVNLLHLPGEAFIEYQLYAQSLRPDDFVAVAAYGESTAGYICVDAALSEGGYEPSMSRVGLGTEYRLKAAIASLLAPGAARTPPTVYPDKLHLLTWQAKDGTDHPARNLAEWRNRRANILASMELVMGPLPALRPKAPLNLKVLSETRLPGVVRRHIRYETGAGPAVPAWLLLPESMSARGPAMLCLHQTTPIGKDEPAGLGGLENLHYAHELAKRGYVALIPDYPGFGEYTNRGTSHFQSTTMEGVWNHLRGVDLLSSLPEVDPGRIGVIGHSLGGHNALFLACFDTRIKAVITSCGFNSFWKYRGGDLTGWSHSGYMPRIATRYAKDPNQMPFDFTEVLAAIAPRSVFVNAPMQDDNFEVSGVKDCLLAAEPVYRLLGSPGALVAEHPACGHDFPKTVRVKAYAWLDTILKPGGGPSR